MAYKQDLADYSFCNGFTCDQFAPYMRLKLQETIGDQWTDVCMQLNMNPRPIGGGITNKWDSCLNFLDTLSTMKTPVSDLVQALRDAHLGVCIGFIRNWIIGGDMVFTRNEYEMPRILKYALLKDLLDPVDFDEMFKSDVSKRLLSCTLVNYPDASQVSVEVLRSVFKASAISFDDLILMTRKMKEENVTKEMNRMYSFFMEEEKKIQ